MTDLQIIRAVKASVDAHGIYVTANRIGITHSTLTRFLAGMRCQAHVKEKVGVFAGKPLGKAPAVKLKKASSKKTAKKASKKAPKKVAAKKASKKAAPKKVSKKAKAKRPMKKSKPRAKKVPAAPASTTAVDDVQPEAAE